MAYGGEYSGGYGSDTPYEDLDRRALGSLMRPAPMVEEGGIAGPKAEGVPAESSPESAKPDYTRLGKYANRMGNWSTSADAPSEKFARPWDQQSERYQMLSVLSNFDPRQGITPEVIKALNDANIHGAKFSGNGDKLTVENAGGYDRFGRGGTSDIIKGLKGNNDDTAWQPWFVDETGGGGGAAPVPQAPFSLGPEGVSVAAGQPLDFSNPAFFQSLMGRLQGATGGQGLDRLSLERLLGR